MVETLRDALIPQLQNVLRRVDTNAPEVQVTTRGVAAEIGKRLDVIAGMDNLDRKFYSLPGLADFAKQFGVGTQNLDPRSFKTAGQDASKYSPTHSTRASINFKRLSTPSLLASAWPPVGKATINVNIAPLPSNASNGQIKNAVKQGLHQAAAKANDRMRVQLKQLAMQGNL